MSCKERATNIYNILKHHGINTIILDVYFIMAGYFLIEEYNERSAIDNITDYKHNYGNDMLEYAKELLEKMRGEMNIVILIRVDINGEKSPINEWMAEDIESYNINQEHKPTVISNVNSKYRTLIIGKIKQHQPTLTHVVTGDTEIIYDIRFIGPDKTNFYSEKIYRPAILNIMDKYNIFDYEICNIKSVHSGYVYPTDNYISFTIEVGETTKTAVNLDML